MTEERNSSPLFELEAVRNTLRRDPIRARRSLPSDNIVDRCFYRAMGDRSRPPGMERNFVHLRTCPTQRFTVLQQNAQFDNFGIFSCTKFSSDNRSVIIGDTGGHVHIINLHTQKRKMFSTIDYSVIRHLDPHRSKTSVLISCKPHANWVPYRSALWNLKPPYKILYYLGDKAHAEFNKGSQDKIVTSTHFHDRATIHDAATGRAVLDLIPRSFNPSPTEPTFSPSNKFVFCASALFDATSGKEVKSWNKVSKVAFHPGGVELVLIHDASNSRVVDVRTFRDLRTVPDLNEYKPIFSAVNSGIYAYSTLSDEVCMDRDVQEFWLRTFDSNDYSTIANIKTEGKIESLAVNSVDTQIAALYVPSQMRPVVKIYDVGRI